jgi:hypothetical protein
MLNKESFVILITLLPGFLTKRIVDSLVIRGKTNLFEDIIEALLFSFVIYTLLTIAAITFPPLKIFHLGTIKENAIPQITPMLNYSNILFLLIVSILLGLLVVYVANKGWYFKIFYKLGFTKRTGRIDVWDDIFTVHRKKWILVRLEDGTKILGWPDCYSEDPQKRELFIADATIIDSDGSTRDVLGPGILLTEDNKIKSIEFLD